MTYKTRLALWLSGSGRLGFAIMRVAIAKGSSCAISGNGRWLTIPTQLQTGWVRFCLQHRKHGCRRWGTAIMVFPARSGAGRLVLKDIMLLAGGFLILGDSARELQAREVAK